MTTQAEVGTATHVRATRRVLLRSAGVAAGTSVLGACTPRAATETGTATRPPTGANRTHLIFVTTEDGVSVLDQAGRMVTPPTVVAAATPDWGHVVTARADGAATRVVIQDLASGRLLSATTLHDRLEPRIVSPTGHLVASVTPGGAGIYGLHKPAGRERTTVVLSGIGGERARLDLPGNIEPEAFSPDDNVLFVLDYVPAARPQRYRVGAIDLVTRRARPMLARGHKPVPLGGEEQTRAHRIAAVHDARRALHFTLYSYEADAIAFVHCLHLGQGWTHRVDLPAPFGQQRPGVHAIALSPSGDRLCVVHAPSGKVADIDPDRLVVERVGQFTATGQAGKPNVQVTASGRLIVNVDNTVIATDPYREIGTAGEARGLVLGTGDDIWVGHPSGIARYSLATGKELSRFAVPGLYVLKHVRTTAG